MGIFLGHVLMSIYKLPKNSPIFDSFFLPPVLFDENLTKKMSKLMLYKTERMWYNMRRRVFVMGQYTIPRT